MNLIQLKEIFVQHRSKKKNLLHFLHRYHFFREMWKILLPQENWMHLWSDLGKIKIYPILVGQMTFLMSQMITRHKYISNEISWAQFGVEEDLQKLTATALCLEAASFCSFWPVLGDLIFDRENELKIEKFQLGWKVDSIIFPKSYPMPNLDTRKVSKSLLQKGVMHWDGATHWAVVCSVIL